MAKLFQALYHSVQLLSCVWLFVTPWTAALQASLYISNFQSLLKLMSIESVIPSNHLILCRPFYSCSQYLPASESFPVCQFFTSGCRSIRVSASAPALTTNIQGWFPLGLTSLISLLSKGLSKVFSSTTDQKHQSSALSTQLSGPTLTPIHEYLKNHSFDYTDLCWQSNVSAF